MDKVRDTAWVYARWYPEDLPKKISSKRNLKKQPSPSPPTSPPVDEANNIDADYIVESLAMMRNEMPPSSNVELVSINKVPSMEEVPNVENINNKSPLIATEPLTSSTEVSTSQCEPQPANTDSKISFPIAPLNVVGEVTNGAD